MTINFSIICQIFSGSGQILHPGQLYRSPGLAKIAPWWLVRRDYFCLKYRDSYRRTAPPTFTTSTAGPLGVRVCAPPHTVFVREFAMTIIFHMFYLVPALPIQFYLDGQLSLTYRDLHLGTVFWYRDKSCSSAGI